MIKVKVFEDETVEQGLKRFKRLCDKEGLKKALKRKSYYEKPSERRRRKLKERLRAIRKELRIKAKAKTQAMNRARRSSLRGKGGQKPVADEHEQYSFSE